MAAYGCSRVIAQLSLDSFCSPEVKLTMRSWLLSFLAVIVCIVVIAARELHEHTGLVAYRPRIMTGRQQHDVVLREILLRTIVHNDPERRARDEMALEVEDVVDGGVHAEKTLGGASRLEPLPLAPSSSHRLMQIFGSVVPING